MTVSLKSETLFWKKKEFVSFVLSVFVLLIHISSIAQYTSTGSFISMVNENFAFFFKESITRYAVPMFFILSGISFFKDYENKKYYKKIKSRIFTLAIPYLLWNTIWMIFEIICSYSFISNYYVGRELFSINFINILEAIFFYKCNLPFWFIFDLIIFSIAAPLIYVFIRNKYIGIFSVILLTALYIFEIEIPSSIFYSSSSIIYYFIGALIGKHYFDFVSKKSSRKMQYCSVVFLVTYILLRNIFSAQENFSTHPWNIIFYSLCAFALWNITDIFIDKIKHRSIYSHSFAIYAMHTNVSAIVTKLIFICLPKSEWLAIPNFIITVILTLFLINLFCVFLEKFFPQIYCILMGNRLNFYKKV